MPYIPYTRQAVIGWHNVFTFGTLSASSESTTGPMENAVDGLTWDFWEFDGTTGGDTLEVIFEGVVNRRVNYLAIAEHNFGTNELSISIEWSDDGAVWNPLAGPFSPESDAPHLWTFDSVLKHAYRVVITGGSGQLGVLNAGHLLELPEGIYVGHRPATLNRKPKILTNDSEGGQLLGRSVIRSGSGVEVQQDHVDPDWVRETLQEFIDHQETKGFFFAWRKDERPLEVIYGWTPEGEVTVEQESTRYMRVNFQVRGIVE